MMKKLTIGILLTIGLLPLFGCKDGAGLALEPYLLNRGAYVHRIGTFYIIGSDAVPTCKETTPGTSAKDIFDHTVRLFSSFLDQDGDGTVDSDKRSLQDGLGKHMLFVIGPKTFVNKISAAVPLETAGLYAMSMQTDLWPYISGYNGKGWTVSKLDSSTWRPPNFNALWEEVFHTVTETYSRIDPKFTFQTGGPLRTLMDGEIAAKTYDISVQNREEGGAYDRVTAVNEYIHQIWAIQYAGQNRALNGPQTQALNFMKASGVPMTVDPASTGTLGTRLKG